MPTETKLAKVAAPERKTFPDAGAQAFQEQESRDPTDLNKISPTNGISDNKNISILGKEGTVFPTKGAPAKPVKPVAKIVNPSPVAT